MVTLTIACYQTLRSIKNDDPDENFSKDDLSEARPGRGGAMNEKLVTP
jgi:hypothetical protein